MARGRKKGGGGAGSQFLKCPKGHDLPHRTNKGQCSPNYCAGSASGGAPPTRLRAKAKKETKKAVEIALRDAADREIDKIVPTTDQDLVATKATAKAAKIEHIAKMGNAIGRLAARRAFLQVPDGLNGEDAEAWADAKLTTLLPDAVADLEYDLKLGDDGQRRHARDRILDATGRGKRENGVGGAQPIIILTGGAVQNPPWKKEPKVIDVSVVPEKLE